MEEQAKDVINVNANTNTDTDNDNDNDNETTTNTAIDEVAAVKAEYKDDLYQPKISELAQKFLADLELERNRLLRSDFPLCHVVIEDAIERLLTTGRIPGRQYYADVFKQRPMKLAQKVFVPVKQYPKFNFAGKILGPRGNSLRRLQEETQCKIAVKGRTSMRDRCREEELRNSGDPRYKHLNKDLHLEISTLATPAESYARIAYALAEIRKYLIPDKNDDVSHEQLRELLEIQPEQAKHFRPGQNEIYRAIFDRKPSHGYMPIMKHTSFNPLDAHHELSDGDQHYEYSTRLLPTVPLLPAATVTAGDPLTGAVPRMVPSMPTAGLPASVDSIVSIGTQIDSAMLAAQAPPPPAPQLPQHPLQSPRYVYARNMRAWGAHRN